MKLRAKFFLTLLLSIGLSAPAFAAKNHALALDRDISAYHRFIIYPHLDKGFEAMRRGDRQRALDEFQQVRQLAPQSVQTAIYLADAYRHFDLPELAQATLDEQRRYTPNDARLQQMPVVPQMVQAQTEASPATQTDAESKIETETDSPYQQLAHAKTLPTRSDNTALAAYLQSVQPVFPNAIDEQQWLALLNQASQGPLDLLKSYSPRFAVNQRYVIEQRILRFLTRNDTAAAERLLDTLPPNRLREARFELALKTQNFVVAGKQAQALWHEHNKTATQLDAISYRLIVAGGQREAADLLLAGYPFTNATTSLRESLLTRLTQLISADPTLITTAQRNVLVQPLDSDTLRNLQVEMITTLGDCSAAHAFLNDYASLNTADHWRQLGDCYRGTSPGLAQYAYAKAQQLRPDAYLTRLLAYQAFATHDYASALDAWRSLPPTMLTLDDLKAAINTALAGHYTEVARTWLDTYAEHGGTQDDEYWWLRAQADSGEAPEIESADLARAIGLRPDARYYGRLATLQKATGQPELAVKSLEKAVALDSENPQWLSALAYLYSDLNHPSKARINLERAKTLRPGDRGIVQQLIYVNQKFGNNEQARYYARQVIDDLNQLPADVVTDDDLNLRFGLQRLHEELSRRWRFSVDATSGNVVTPVTKAAQPGTNYRSYMQAEAEYRLGDPASNDGKTLAAYSRVFAGSGAQGKALPFYSPMLAGGLRWKPWGQQIIYFAVEQQAPLDNSVGSQADTMLRASASFLNGGRFSDDWHTTGSSWVAQNLYLDGARYIKGERTALTADYRLSYHQKIGANETAEPYAHLQYNLSTPQANSAFDKDVRVGLGVRWNIWGGGDRYNAPTDKITIGLEIQHALSTYQNEKNSVFLSIGRRL